MGVASTGSQRQARTNLELGADISKRLRLSELRTEIPVEPLHVNAHDVKVLLFHPVSQYRSLKEFDAATD